MKKNILVGVTAGIAAYKACSLVNYFIKEGADVKVMMTKSATKLVTPLTFQALTNHAVYVDMWDSINTEEVEHISLAKWADICVIAPATANTISKITLGLADNFLTTVVLALPKKTKVVIAPAMNTEMWNNPIIVSHIKSLKQYKDKYYVIDPQAGILACRDEGIGKIAKIEDISSKVFKLLK